MTENLTVRAALQQIRENPITYSLSTVFAIIGLAQFIGLLGNFLGERVVGLLLAMYAIQSMVFVSRSRNYEVKAQTVVDAPQSLANMPQLAGEGSTRVRLYEIPDSLSSVFGEALDVMVVGVSAAGIIEAYSDEIEARASDAEKSTRFLLVHPDSDALVMVAQRDQMTPKREKDTIQNQRNRVEDQLDILRNLKTCCQGNFAIRLSEYPIDCEYIFADFGQHKVIYLRHYTFKTNLGPELRVALEAHRTPNFDHYDRHLKQLWKYGDELAS